MQSNSQNLRVEQVKKASANFIEQFTALLEKGVVWDEKAIWDSEEGNKFIANGDNALFVAYVENNLVGFLTAHRLQRFDNKKAEVMIYDVGVHKDFRGRGIGKKLIETIKIWAKEVKAHEVWVLANRSNPQAIALYQSTGAEEDEEKDIVMFTYKISDNNSK